MDVVDLVETGARSIRVGRYSTLAGYTVAIYDWVISIDEEYDLVWMTPQWTAIKCAFILCRYFVLLFFPIYVWLFLGNHAEHLCEDLVHPLYGLMTLFHLFPQVVMIVRTWAFTGRNSYVLFFLILCLLGFVAADAWVFGANFNIHPAVHAFYGDSGCFGTDLDAPEGTPSFKPGVSTDHAQSMLATTQPHHLQMVMVSAFLMDLCMMVIIVANPVSPPTGDTLRNLPT
ncbi:hypothetical protein E1B28_012323 [Marasmius oreades]|uniref:DUF6533 domain-containing protein n=1 Tax=Marasmius oreades TaxID=181124 RepID=A0A9P7RRY7_9AGAR|nr:uncharacterized protein E1B28_012323 [Marasmius oreades]KAG7088313.1 hypothetical protein E1B28_012323 [Marasmius oreades]